MLVFVSSYAVIITYCVDGTQEGTSTLGAHGHNNTGAAASAGSDKWQSSGQNSGTSYGNIAACSSSAASASHGANSSTHHHPTQRYTLADVPRLAEYSAGVYASNAAEHAHYRQYYTEYYVTEITAGNLAGLPTMAQIVAAESEAADSRRNAVPDGGNGSGGCMKTTTTERERAVMMPAGANSGAAVALSAIMRKQQAAGSASVGAGGRTMKQQKFGGKSEPESKKVATVVPAVQVPTGRDNRVYGMLL